MSLFEFIMVLESIVVGLGLAKVLSGLSHAILSRQATPAAWQPLLLATIIFLTLLQIWWEAWALRSHAVWTFGQLLVLLTNPVLLYVLAHLAFPLSSDDSLRDHYFARHRVVFSVVAGSAVASALGPAIAFGAPLIAFANLSAGITAFGAVVLAITPNPAIHGALLLVGAGIAAINVLAAMPNLS